MTIFYIFYWQQPAVVGATALAAITNSSFLQACGGRDMPIRGVALTVEYLALNTSTNQGQTGDAANHTLRWVKDGTAAAPANAPSTEVDATNCPGIYKLSLTAAEMTCDSGLLCGKSATANVLIIPVSIFTEHGVLPTVQQGSAGAVVTSGTGTAQINVSGGIAQADVARIAADAAAPGNLANTYNGTGYVATTAPAQQQQVANIAVTGAALNKVASSLLLTTGTDTGGVANTNTLDGVFDNWADATGTIDGYYQFDLSGTTNAVATVATWDGYLVGVVNLLKVFAFNWGNSAWDQLGTVVGMSATVVQSQEFDLTSAHTGTGGNLGLVRIRFQNTGLVSATLKTDRILVGYVVTPNTVTPPTVGQIATALWQDLTSSADFTTSGSIGKLLATFSFTGANVNANAQAAAAGLITASVFTQGAADLTWVSATRTLTSSLDPTAATIATTLWQDLTAGADFGTAGSIGALLKADIDATISSRLATSGYTVPPTAAAIATTLWQDLTSSGDFSTAGSIGALLKLDIDATISSRLATSGYTVPPTAAAIATAHWTDLTAGSDFSTGGSIGALLKLDIDAAISSRLPTSSYVTPPTTAAIATAVMTDVTDVVGADVVAIKAKTDNLPASPAAVGSAMTLADGAITDAKIAVPADTAGPATTILAMVLQLWQRFYGKTIWDKVGNTLKTFLAGGSTRTTQVTVTDVNHDEVDAAV